MFYLHTSNPELLANNKNIPIVTYSPSTYASPLVLSHVNRRWREITRRYPNLWASIHVIGPKSQSLPLIAEWLYRSGNRPLSIYYSQSKGWDSPPQHLSNMNRMLQLFAAHVRRWKSIDFNFRGGELAIGHPCQHNILFSNEMDFRDLRMLESVSINENRAWIPGPLIHLWSTIAQNSPNLRSARGCIPINSSTLSSFTCQTSTSPFHVVVQILRDCPNLKELNMRLCPPSSPDLNIPPVTHRKLKILKLHNPKREAGLMEDVFSRVTLPRLSELDCNFDGGKSMVRALRHMLQRSDCRLSSLNTIPFEGVEDEIYKLFACEQLQSLKSLIISRAHSDHFLDWITIRPPQYQGDRTARMVLPSLKKIHMMGLTVSLNSLARFASSRPRANIVIESPWHFDEHPKSSKWAPWIFEHRSLAFRNPCGCGVDNPQKAQPWHKVKEGKNKDCLETGCRASRCGYSSRSHY
ncbi:hypothetical protein NP233_g8176 [Leucocoprinus birnbaumii]|uniref:F-box domain-containing protein n=1 Tax=Leucocoprinus birnbaumii TaxID=56174 RepID=A0AAD5VNK3_9AGAR|nr:hypothetical protein NP233_g8176 [Leucocoprinus birnbaumii]